MLKSSHFKLLNTIKLNMTLDELSNLFGVTERSIRYQINEINSILGYNKINIKKRKIVSILPSDEIEKISQKINANKYSYSQEERLDIIIILTLIGNNDFSIKNISEYLNISESTLRVDIKKLTHFLKNYSISFSFTNNFKYEYKYKEIDLRYFATYFLYKYLTFDLYEDRVYISKSNYFEQLIYNEILKEYYDDITDIYMKLKEMKLEYMDETLHMLIVLMAYSKKRSNKILLNELSVDIKILKEREEYTELNRVFSDFSEEDILLFTEYLFMVSCGDDNIFDKYPYWTSIEFAICKMVKNLSCFIQIKEENYTNLIEDLLFYIKPLIFRTKKNLKLKNSILYDIKNSYKDIFDVISNEYIDIENIIGKIISEEEKAFLFTLFKRSIEDYLSYDDKVILVTSYKKNIAYFLKTTIEDEFSIKIDKVYTLSTFCSDRDIKLQINENRKIFIITTDDIKIENSNTKIIKVNPILNDNDIKKIINLGIPRKNKVKISELINIVSKNIVIVNKDRLIKSLIEKFPDIMINDLVENDNDFSKIQKNVFDLEENTIEYALYTITEKFISDGSIKKYHVDEIISYYGNTTRFFLDCNTVIFFPRNNENINGMGFSMGIFNKKGIMLESFEIKKIIFFYSDRKQKHIEFLNYIVKNA